MKLSELKERVDQLALSLRDIDPEVQVLTHDKRGSGEYLEIDSEIAEIKVTLEAKPSETGYVILIAATVPPETDEED